MLFFFEDVSVVFWGKEKIYKCFFLYFNLKGKRDKIFNKKKLRSDYDRVKEL